MLLRFVYVSQGFCLLIDVLLCRLLLLMPEFVVCFTFTIVVVVRLVDCLMRVVMCLIFAFVDLAKGVVLFVCLLIYLLLCVSFVGYCCYLSVWFCLRIVCL